MRKSKLYLIGLLVLALSSCTSKKQQTAEITPNVPKIILETDIETNYFIQVVRFKRKEKI